jgi:hypothetical protein
MPRADVLLATLLAGLTVVSRVPFRARLLPSWDAVQFALALREPDLLKHQPHPPGSILYVGAARILDALLADPVASLVWLSIGGSALAVFLTYRLAWSVGGRATAAVAALGLATSPLAWFNGELPLPYAVESALAVSVAVLVRLTRDGRPGFVLWSALALGLAGGVRQSLLVLLAPLWLFGAWGGLRRPSPVLRGLGVLGLSVAVWLVPTLWLAGGPAPYAWAMRELFDSTVWATTVLEGIAGVGGNVRGLLDAGLMALGLWLPVAVYGLVRGPRRAPTPDSDGGFFLAWIGPPLLVYTLVHFGQYAYLLTVLPAVYILIARWLVGAAGRLGDAARAPLERAGLAALVSAVTLGHATYFVAAVPVDVPEREALAPGAERQVAALRAIYRFRLWANTAPGLREQEAVIRVYRDTVRRRFDPGSTVLVTELGNPRAYPWFRHATYYLREFTTVHLRLGGYSRGYLSTQDLRTMAARPGREVLLPPGVERLVWLVDAWNPMLPRPPGLREEPLPHGRWLYTLDLDGRPVGHGDYRLTPGGASSRRRARSLRPVGQSGEDLPGQGA